MKTPKKANAGAYLAIAQQAKGVAPNAVDALDRKIARKLDGPKYSDAPLFAKKGALITMSDGHQFKKVSKTFAKKNWNKVEIFGINQDEDYEGVIDSKDEIENYDDFGVETSTKMSGGGLIKSFSKSQLDDITNESDLDDALIMAQENIGVDTGDVAGVFFSKYKDADAMWEKSTPSKRLSILKEYLKVEESYKMSTGGTTIIDETGSNVPSDLVDVFNEFDEDADSYKEMERLKLKANELGYDFDYDLSGGPTEFWKLKTGGYILKQSHLSSEEYQKAKKLKGFDKKDYTWNVATKLYDKSVRKMHGGYIESMGDDFNKGLDRITMAFKKWYNGPMTELDDVMPAIEDIADYVKSRLISEISSVDIYALKPQGSFDDSDKVVARLNKNAPFKIADEQGNGWRVYFENFPQIIVYATPFWDEEPGTTIVFRDDDDEVIYEHFLPFDYKEPMLSFEDLYKYYRMAVIPWVEESMYNLIVERNFNYFVERGNHYDILDLGTNEWMPDWEFLGPAVINNETFEYYMHNSASSKGFIAVVNEIRMTMFVETRNFESGDTIVAGDHTKPFEGKDSVLKQLENLENGQELILTSYDSVSKEDDIYYAYKQGGPGIGGQGIVIDDLESHLCDIIYSCIIDDYEGIQVDDDRLVFIGDVQFDSRALSFTLPELLDDLRTGLIRPHSSQYETGGKTNRYEQGGTIYEFSYRDEEGDLYEEVFDTLKEAKDTIKEYRKEGYDIVETWIYKDGQFKGRFETGGKTQTMLGNKLSEKYPEFNETIKYAGDTLTLFTVFTEKNKNWDSEAQKMIDNEKRRGRRAAVIHKGKNHGLYLKAQFDKGGYVVGSEVLFKSGRNGDETRGQILKVLDGNEYAVASGFSQTLVKKDDIIGKAPEKKWYQFEDGGNIDSWKSFVLKNKSWFKSEHYDNKITLMTRDNSVCDNGDCSYGEKDLKEAKKIERLVLKKYPNTDIQIQADDFEEYVVIHLELPQYKKGGKTKETWVQKSVEEMEKKGTVGLFTKKAKKAGMSTTAYAKKVLNKKNEKKYSLKTRREAQWMKNMNPELFKS